MAHYIPKDAFVAELKFRKEQLERYKNISETADACYDEITRVLSLIDTLEVKDVDLENYNKVKRLLSLSFMHFLDANLPEGKMCLSNGECFDIDKAFNELDFAKLFRYMEKYLKAQK